MLRELNSRSSGGLTVTLLWESESTDDELGLVVAVEGFGAEHRFEAPLHDAEAAFMHPFAYKADLPNPFVRENDEWFPEMPDLDKLADADDGEEELAPVS